MTCDMANDIIKKHNFELAKNRIKSLALQIPPSVSLESFSTEKFLGLISHKVTGEEINTKLLNPLQEKLKDQNEHLRKLYKTADEVYKALDSLDKEYVSGIVGTAEAAALASDQALTASENAQKASNQALAASSQALDASKKATTAQADIKRTIEALQTTVRILKEFKEKVTKDLSSIASLNTRITSLNSKIQDVENKINDVADSANKIKDFRALLESYQHLSDIDAIWSDVEDHKTNLASFHQQVDAFVEKVNQATARIDGDIEALKQYRTLLESYQHLGDVDAIWSDVEGHKTNLASFHQQVDAFVEKVNQATTRIDGDIEVLKQYRTLLESYQHLGDVDAIWSDVESQKTDLLGLHEKLDAFIEETHLGLERIDGLILQLEEINYHVHLQYNKKIKIAFWLGGSAVGLIVINYILQIIGVL